MVNFIIRDGDKFVLNGNELMRTENPVLEVPDIGDSSDVTGLVTSTEVQVGDLLVKTDSVLEKKKGHNHSYCYYIDMYEQDGRLHAFAVDNYFHRIYVYENGKWDSKADFTNNDGHNVAYGSIPQASHATHSNIVNGRPTYITYRHESIGGLYPFSVNVIDEDGQVTSHNPLHGLDVSSWPSPYVYTIISDREYRYQIFGGSVFQDSSGIIHCAVTYQGAPSRSSSGYDSNWDGYGTMKIYTLDPSTFQATEVSYDLSTTNNRAFAVDFLEVSGQVFLCRVQEAADVDSYLNFALSSGDPLYPPSARVSTEIYKWNPSTQHWNWHQYNKTLAEYATFGKVKGAQIDASTYVFQRSGSVRGEMFTPYRYTASSGYFEPWGQFELSTLPRGAYGSSRVFKHNNNYYLYAVGAVRFSNTFEGGIYFENHNQDPSGNNELIKYSGVRLYKYNPSTDYWDRIRPEDLQISPLRASPGATNQNFSISMVGNAYTFNGETHFAVGHHQGFGPDAIKFFKFNPDDESVTDTSPYSEIPPIPTSVHPADDLVKNGITYRAFGSNSYPYLHVLTYSTSGDDAGKWVTLRYMPDIVGSYSHNVRWYESSNGNAYLITNAYNPAPYMWMYELDVSGGQLRKISDDNLTLSSSVGSTRGKALEIFELSGKTYLYRSDTDLLELYEIVEDASGIPVLLDTSVTMPTRIGGTHIQYNDQVYVYDGKVFHTRGAYNAPYGPEVHSWDGSSASWTQMSSVTERFTNLEGSTFQSANYSRCRHPMHLFEINGDLYYFYQNDNYPFEQFFKYDSYSNLFREVVMDPYFRPTTPVANYAPKIIWRNKLWFIIGYGSNSGALPNILRSFDGSSSQAYGMGQYIDPVRYQGLTYGDFFIDENDELYLIGSNGDHDLSLKYYKLNETALQYGGKGWKKLEDLGSTLYLSKFGVALESGVFNDKIKIREIRKV